MNYDYFGIERFFADLVNLDSTAVLRVLGIDFGGQFVEPRS